MTKPDLSAIALRLATDPTPAGIERALRDAYAAGKNAWVVEVRVEAAKHPPQPGPHPSIAEMMPDLDVDIYNRLAGKVDRVPTRIPEP